MGELKDKQVIFIMGHARSGSTILNIMLGSNDKVVAAGETGNFYRSALINNEYCSCDAKLQECEFWGGIAAKMKVEIKQPIDDFILYSRNLENWRNILFPHRMAKKNLNSDSYLEINRKLYDQIFKHAHSSTLIDASKDPMRFFHLRAMSGVQFTVLHIVRDPRAVCWSQAKSFKKDIKSGLERDMPGTSYLKTIKSLYINAYLSEKMKKLNSHSVATINYDDLARFPEQSLQQIEAASGLSTHPLLDKLRNNEELTQFHGAAGNRLRLSKSIVVRHDESWKEGLSTFQYFIITALTYPLLKRYGFTI